jgi:hypothetical protein
MIFETSADRTIVFSVVLFKGVIFPILPLARPRGEEIRK